jgi:hypothetical protein
MFAGMVKKKPINWKHMIVSVHMMLHSAMISCLYRRHTDKYNDDTRRIMIEMNDYTEEKFKAELNNNTKKAIKYSDPHVLTFVKMYKKIFFDNDEGSLAIVERINDYRKSFVHYDGDSNVVSIVDMQSVACDSLCVLRKIMERSFVDPMWDWSYDSEVLDQCEIFYKCERRKRAYFKKIEKLKMLLSCPVLDE